MRPRIDVRHVVTHKALTTPTKTRILAGGVHSAKQQVVRVDRTARAAIPDAVRSAIARRVLSALGRADALLVSDYGTGFVTPALVRSAQRLLRGRRAGPTAGPRRLPLRAAPVPPHGDVHAERVGGGAAARCADRRERARARTGRPAAARIAPRPGAVLVTRGSRGMALFEPGRPTVHIPIYGSDQIADVTGAGTIP